MADGTVLIEVDPEVVLAVAGVAFTVVGILLVVLAKVIVNGINKSITDCGDHLKEKHENHETRIDNLEKAVFKPVNWGG